MSSNYFFFEAVCCVSAVSHRLPSVIADLEPRKKSFSVQSAEVSYMQRNKITDVGHFVSHGLNESRSNYTTTLYKHLDIIWRFGNRMFISDTKYVRHYSKLFPVGCIYARPNQTWVVSAALPNPISQVLNERIYKSNTTDLLLSIRLSK